MGFNTLITLYDVPSNLKGSAWSPNVWKARYVLNFKGISYKTMWLEYPDIEPTMRNIGAAPTGMKPDGSPQYTLPVIVDPSRRTTSGEPMVVSDSFNIAEYLDEVYPTPGPLFPEGTKALQKLFYDHFLTVAILPIVPAFFTTAYGNLNEGSCAYWRRTREAALGGKLEEVCPKGTPKWDEVWANVEKGFNRLATLLDKNGNDASTFVIGNRLTFSDFVIAAFLESIFLVHPEEWSTRVRTWDGGRWERLRALCAEWRSVH